MKVDVVLNPAEIATLQRDRLGPATCVVIDVLRATSTILTALEHGAREIYPVRTIEEAHEVKARWPDAVLAGERHGERIEGFDLGNSPLEFIDGVPDRVVTTTTNGTVALRACEGASEIIVAALLNAGAVLAHLLRSTPESVLLVCAGTFAETALEDVLAAGMICAGVPDADLSDSAHVAIAAYRRFDTSLLAGLSASKNGRVLIGKGRQDEVEWCARVSSLHIVGRMDGAAVRALPAADDL